MSVVSIDSPFDFLEADFREIARLIKTQESFQIISNSIFNANYFVNSFFNDYSVRSKYLGNKLSDYYLIDLSNSGVNSKEVDSFVLRMLSVQIGIEFVNFLSVLNYLEEQDKFVVLYSTTENYDLIRFLLSYSYLTKNRVIYILAGTQRTDFIEKELELELSDAFIQYFIEQKIQELGISVEIDRVIENTQKDLGKVYSEIIAAYNHPKQELVKEKEVESNIEFAEENFDPLFISERQTQESSSFEISSIELPNEGERLVEENIVISAPVEIESMLNVNLTPREESVYRELKEKQFLSRLELAEIVWGKIKGSSASNDAIDQVISRLRKKFVQAGYPRDYIFSKKGEGVGINSITQ